MYVVCPHCKAVYPVAAGRKRRKAFGYCKTCDKKFKATEVLPEHPLGLITEAKAEVVVKAQPVEQPDPVKRKKPFKAEAISPTAVIGIQRHDESNSPERTIPESDLPLPWELEKPPANKSWFYGSALAGVLLVIQLGCFEWENWSQNRMYRPYMESLCRMFGCELPVYRNLGEFEVNQSGLTASSENTLSFKAVISNHAVYPQRYPDIKLKLSDYDETVFAERIFTVKDYLANNKNNPETFPPEETLAIQMELVKPARSIGTYTIDLID